MAVNIIRLNTIFCFAVTQLSTCLVCKYIIHLGKCYNFSELVTYSRDKITNVKSVFSRVPVSHRMCTCCKDARKILTRTSLISASTIIYNLHNRQVRNYSTSTSYAATKPKDMLYCDVEDFVISCDDSLATCEFDIFNTLACLLNVCFML